MNSERNASDRILGSLRVADGAGVVRIADRIETGVEDLWSALTDPERVAEWYGRVTGDLHEGGRIQVRIEGPDIDAVGRIEECEPPRRLVVRTRETTESARRGNGVPFEQTLTATVTPDGDRTALVVEVAGLPLGKIGAYGVGWQLHVESLGAYVSGRPGPDVGARWSELAGSYEDLAAALG